VGEVYAGSEGVQLVSVTYHALQQRLQQEPSIFARQFFHDTASRYQYSMHAYALPGEFLQRERELEGESERERERERENERERET